MVNFHKSISDVNVPFLRSVQREPDRGLSAPLSDSGSSACPQIPEYCRVLEESEISEHCFDLIFAFDEIVALGYRENVNLAQIRTFTEMDSHEEKVFRAVREVRSTPMTPVAPSGLWRKGG